MIETDVPRAGSIRTACGGLKISIGASKTSNTRCAPVMLP